MSDRREGRPVPAGRGLCPHRRPPDQSGCADCERKAAGAAATLIGRAGAGVARAFADVLAVGGEFTEPAAAGLADGDGGPVPGSGDFLAGQLLVADLKFTERAAGAVFGSPPDPSAGMDACLDWSEQARLDMRDLAGQLRGQLAAAEEDR